MALTADDSPGDVPWTECERAFHERFGELRALAERAVADTLARAVGAERERRLRLGAELRAEVEGYRRDRVEELDREEAAERAGARGQTELFRETATNWNARRSAVATHAEARLRAIAEWESIPDADVPEPLGVLLVFPGDDG